MTLVVHAFGYSNVGRIREINEDNFLTGRTVFAVADGMGGHAAGEVASEAALMPLREIDGGTYRDPQAATDALSHAVSQANELVLERAAADPDLRGMGTTLTTVMVRGSRLHLAHVGDSRAYLLRAGMLEMLTEDHTLVNQLVKEGRLTEEQAASHPQRSVITRAIGVELGVQVDTMVEPLELAPGDQVLLCSDGLTGPVSESLIAEILMTEDDGDIACRRLIDAANAGGGPDNITCVLLRVEGDGTVTAPAAMPGPATSSDDDATAELGDPAQLDARRLAELGGGSEEPEEVQAEERSSGRRRLGATLLGVLLVLAVLIGGALLLLNRSFFVGVDDDGQVGIYRGIPAFSIGLVESESFGLDDLPEGLHPGLEGGIAFSSLAEARMHVSDVLEPQLEIEEEEPLPTESPTPSPTPSSEPKDPPTIGADAPGPTPEPTTAPRPTPAPASS